MFLSHSRLTKQIERYHRPLLVILWGILQFLFFIRFGVRTSVDTSRYELIADQILAGKIPAGTDIWYTSFGIIVALLKYLLVGIEWIALLNIAASLGALFIIYNISRRMYKGWKFGFTASLHYILFVKISQWNFIIYTDSLFTSFCIISIGLYMQYIRKLSPRLLLLVIISFLFTVFLRPVGLVFLGCFLIALLEDLSVRRIGYLVGFGLIFLIGLNLVLKDYADSFIEAYSTAEIIYPDLNLGIKVPSDLWIPYEGQPLIRITSFAIGNPVYFLKLFFAKVILFVTGTRPYFSIAHNVVLIVFLIGSYGLAFYGNLVTSFKFLSRFTFLFFLSQIVMVGLTSVNWDGRFLFPILPFIFIFASAGIIRLLKRLD